MTKEIKICNFSAEYVKNSSLKEELMYIDVTNFFNGYGELSDVNSFSDLMLHLVNDGWKNEGITMSNCYGIVEYTLKVKRKL